MTDKPRYIIPDAAQRAALAADAKADRDLPWAHIEGELMGIEASAFREWSANTSEAKPKG